MIIEIVIGVAFAIVLFVLQGITSKKVTDMTKEMHDFIQHTAEVEQKNKVAQCQIIIIILKDIENREKSIKETLSNYQIGNPTNELSNFFMEIIVPSFKYKISKMNNAIGQLQGRLNDPYLGEEFTEYLGWFDFLPKKILIEKLPQQAKQQHQIDSLIDGIDKQLEKIQAFIDKFTQEMEYSSAEKHKEVKLVTSGIDYSKYHNAPKL
jgi:hypothetical protein